MATISSISLNTQDYPPLPLKAKRDSEVNPKTLGSAPQIQGDRSITGADQDLGDISKTNGVIYQPGQTVQTPFVVSYLTNSDAATTTTFWSITVSNIPANLIGQTYWVCPRFFDEPGFTQLPSHFLFKSDVQVLQEETTFTIKLQSGISVPFGMNEYWSFYMSPGTVAPADVYSSPESVLLGTQIPMEFYVLIPPLPQFWQLQQSSSIDKKPSDIPLLLLRMFLLPVTYTHLDLSSNGQAGYISLVTNICIGFQKPISGETIAIPPAAQTAIKGAQRKADSHWLKYEVWNGKPSFVGESGGDFNLDSWLMSYRSYQAMGVSTCVNCYDQAGITDIALSLCLDPADLVWTYKKPFGFIPATDYLVGWGHCNNPYFAGDMQGIITDPLDKARWPFKNHVFITYNQSNSSQVIDACAGPWPGVAVSTYNNSLDKNSDPDRLKNVIPHDPSKDHDKITGTHGHVLTAVTLKERWQDWYGVPNRSLYDIALDFSQDQSSGACFVNVDSLKSWFDQYVKKNIWNTPNDTTTQPIVPITGPDTIQLEHKMWLDTSVPDSFAYFRLYFTDGFQTALNVLDLRINQMTMPEGTQINVTSNSSPARVASLQDNLTLGHVDVEVFGSKHLKMFVYKNLVVEIGNLEGNDDKMVSLMKDMWNQIYTADQSADPPLSLSQWNTPAASYINTPAAEQLS